jgi:hypothetical protein
MLMSKNGPCVSLAVAFVLVLGASGCGQATRTSTTTTQPRASSDARLFFSAVHRYVPAIEREAFAAASRMNSELNNCPVLQRPDVPSEAAILPVTRAYIYERIARPYRELAIHVPSPTALRQRTFKAAVQQIRMNADALSPFARSRTEVCSVLRRWAKTGFTKSDGVYAALGISENLFPDRARQLAIKQSAIEMRESGLSPAAVDQFERVVDLSLYP